MTVAWRIALAATFVLIFATWFALAWVWSRLAQLANVVEQSSAGRHS